MRLNASDWTGTWENFELWIDSDDPELAAAWREVEQAVSSMPPQVGAMFGDDPRAFWRMACATTTPESPVRLGGWRISEANGAAGIAAGGNGADGASAAKGGNAGANASGNGAGGRDAGGGHAPALEIEWLADGGSVLGRGRYVLGRVIEHGLEGKPNLLLKGTGTELPDAYGWLLVMEPMPEREARESGGLLAHTHFQFASSIDGLLTPEGQLVNPRWYATMVDAARDNAERIHVIRALHHLG